MSKHIYDLISQGEHLHLDFKFEISDAKKIARTFSAFANTKGGTLLIGVKDNGAIRGVQTDEELYMAESSATMYSKPEVNFTIKTWTIKDKTILEIKIPESLEKPHLAPWKDGSWKAFVRVNDENVLADTILVDIWKNQRKSKEIYLNSFAMEKELLDYIAANNELDLKQVMAFCKLNYYKAKKMVANLVYLNILDYTVNKSGTKFHLR